jgi:hypothetical protein
MKKEIIKVAVVVLCLAFMNVLGISQEFKEIIIQGKMNGKVALKSINITNSLRDTGNLKLESRTVPVINGAFKFCGKIKHPQAVHLWYEDDDTTYFTTDIFFVEAGVQDIMINLDKMTGQLPVITGSAIHNRYLKYYEPLKLQIEQDRVDSLSNLFIRADPTGMTSKKLMRTFYQERNKALLRAFEHERTSLIAGWVMLRFLHYGGYDPTFDELFQQLSKDFVNTDIGKAIEKKITAAKAASIGGTFPSVMLKDYTLKDMFFEVRKDSTNQQKYTFVDFWFSQCYPCIKQFPALVQISKSSLNRHLDIIGISIDAAGQITNWQHAIVKYNLPWKQYLDEGGVFAKTLNIVSYPSNFLIAPNGLIIARDIEPDEIEKNINAHQQRKTIE